MQCEWPCSVCSATFVSDDKVKLSRMRDNHINRVHGELPRSLFPTLNGQMGSERPAGSKDARRTDKAGGFGGATFARPLFDTRSWCHYAV